MKHGEIIINDKQFGLKIGKHARDFNLDPGNPMHRGLIRGIIDDIITTPDEVRLGTWLGQTGEVTFYIKGDDVVITNDAVFVTILKNGITNRKIANARRLSHDELR